jgi:hypothetical protein
VPKKQRVLFSLRKYCDGICFLKHNAVWLEYLFDSSNNFDVIVMYYVFYSWDDNTNLRNRQVRTRLKRGMGKIQLGLLFKKYVNSKPYISCIFFCICHHPKLPPFGWTEFSGSFFISRKVLYHLTVNRVSYLYADGSELTETRPYILFSGCMSSFSPGSSAKFIFVFETHKQD